MSASLRTADIMPEEAPVATVTTVTTPTITPLARLKGDTLVARNNLSISEGPAGGLTLTRGVLTADLTAEQANQIHVIQVTGQLDLSGNVADGADYLITGNGNVNISGVTIVEASAGVKVDADSNIAGIDFNNVGTVTVNGTRANYFITVWDELDDRYGVAGYYAVDINAAFVGLGIQYADYLLAGNTALTDFTAKYSATRNQSIHDNLLGNLNGAALADRGLTSLYNGVFTTRPYYDGNATSDPLPTIQWDYANGVVRTDYAIVP